MQDKPKDGMSLAGDLASYGVTQTMPCPAPAPLHEYPGAHSKKPLQEPLVFIALQVSVVVDIEVRSRQLAVAVVMRSASTPIHWRRHV